MQIGTMPVIYSETTDALNSVLLTPGKLLEVSQVFYGHVSVAHMRVGIVFAIAVAVAVVIVIASGIGDVSKWYFERSSFTYGSGPIREAQHMALPDHKRPARPAHVTKEAEDAAVARVGVAGRRLGTYVYNDTHYVTLVEKAPLAVYAVIWNNETAVAKALNFVKYVEKSHSETLRRDGNYTYAVGWRYVGYIDASGVLPFDVYIFYDENWGRWDTPTGYFKVAAAGYFTIIYGVAVYVDDRSYYELTDPMLRLCSFSHYVEGSGTPLAGVHATGRAITITCTILGTVFDIKADLSYDAWGNRGAPPAVGNKWFTSGCLC